jgi:hypothetical protein
MVNGSILGGYASAPSAFGPWSFQETTAAYGDVMQLSDGTRLEMGRRERPHLLLDARGEPRYLYTGVCPKGGGSMANETGHSFTAVQGCKTDDGTLVKQKSCGSTLSSMASAVPLGVPLKRGWNLGKTFQGCNNGCGPGESRSDPHNPNADWVFFSVVAVGFDWVRIPV